MKRTIAAFFIIAATLGRAQAGERPNVYYSDIVSGPQIGGEEGQGVFVTLRGKDFGASRGTGFVTIGGGKASRYLVWNDTTITFQPGPAARCGFITVTTLEGTSDGVPFALRGGGIYFVDAASPNDPGSGTFADPWRNPSSFITRMKAGDTCYFRAGTYDGTYTPGNPTCTIAIGREAPDGMRGFDIAFAAYPGETVRLEAVSSATRTNIDIAGQKRHYAFSGFTLSASAENVFLRGNDLRIVNTVFEGSERQEGTMLSVEGTRQCKVYGCEFRNAASCGRPGHVMRVHDGAADLDLGWNSIHDNDLARGPLVLIGGESAGTQGAVFSGMRVHENIIDCTNGPQELSALGIEETGCGSSAYVYGNVFVAPGGKAALYLRSGSGYFYNNTVWRSRSDTVFFAGNAAENVEIKNNIVHVLADGASASFPGERYVKVQKDKTRGYFRVSHNCYFGSGAGPVDDPCAVNADPRLNDALHPLLGSPCADTGDDSVKNVLRGKNAPMRWLYGSADIGACEATAGPAQAGAKKRMTAAGTQVLVLGSSSGRGTVHPDKGDTAKIYFRGSEAGTVEVRIFTLLGEEVWRDEMEGVSEGMFEWEPRGMAGGIYVVSIRGAGIRERKNIAVIR